MCLNHSCDPNTFIDSTFSILDLSPIIMFLPTFIFITKLIISDKLPIDSIENHQSWLSFDLLLPLDWMGDGWAFPLRLRGNSRKEHGEASRLSWRRGWGKESLNGGIKCVSSECAHFGNEGKAARRAANLNRIRNSLPAPSSFYAYYFTLRTYFMVKIELLLIYLFVFIESKKLSLSSFLRWILSMHYFFSFLFLLSDT